MAEITIRFRHNAATGKKELVVHLESDSDVLSHEHEGDHRALVEKLIGQKLDADTAVVVERVEKDGSVVQEGEAGQVAAKQAEKA
jgi:hypothetical protein